MIPGMPRRARQLGEDALRSCCYQVGKEGGRWVAANHGVFAAGGAHV